MACLPRRLHPYTPIDTHSIIEEHTQRLKPVAGEGVPLAHFPVCEFGVGVIGASVASRKIFSVDRVHDGPLNMEQPLLCIPLWLSEDPIGAIVVYRLLHQKDGFKASDHELFSLLAEHSATAIVSSQMYGKSERRLRAIQGLIETLSA